VLTNKEYHDYRTHHGHNGQDGAYLASFLLNRGYQVYGTYRRCSSPNFWRIQELGISEHPRLHLREYDITDLSAALRLIETTKPDENLQPCRAELRACLVRSANRHGQYNRYWSRVRAEAIRAINPRIRFYQASTAEMFGATQSFPQDETTPFYPRSPYGAAKLYAHWMTVNYREAYGIFASSGILFNHESPLRGPSL